MCLAMSWTWGIRSWMCGSCWPGRWMVLPMNCTCAPPSTPQPRHPECGWLILKELPREELVRFFFLLGEDTFSSFQRREMLCLCVTSQSTQEVSLASGLWGASEPVTTRASSHTRGQWRSRGITLQLTQLAITRDAMTEWKLAFQRELLMLQCLAKLCMFFLHIKIASWPLDQFHFFSYAFKDGKLFLHTFGKRQWNPFSLLNLGLSMS